MKKVLLTLALGLAASVASATVYEVAITGPGGHSNGSYGNTNAVHAGARAVLALAIFAAVPPSMPSQPMRILSLTRPSAR